MSDQPTVTTIATIDVIADTNAYIQAENTRIDSAKTQITTTLSTLDAQIAQLQAQRQVAQKVSDLLDADKVQAQQLAADVVSLTPAATATATPVAEPEPAAAG